VLIASYFIYWRLDRSYFGRACRAIRDNPEAAAAMGVNVARTKIVVFTITSVLAGAAGMAYAFVDNIVNPPVFGLENVFLLLFMVIIGGSGRHAGAIVGAVLLYMLPFGLAPLIGPHHALVFGIVMVAAMLFRPDCLVGFLDRLRVRARPRARA
jgi:branched-chain amino acid transport system permease protein